jgi:hypothetical protein
MKNISILVFGENNDLNECVADNIVNHLGGSIAQKYFYNRTIDVNSLPQTDYEKAAYCTKEYVNSGNYYKFVAVCTFNNINKKYRDIIEPGICVYAKPQNKEKIEEVIEVSSKILPQQLINKLNELMIEL